MDAGVEEGDDVPVYYDPMVSKLTTWGRTRDEAIDRMSRALTEYEVAGIPTTIPFGRFVMRHPAFRSGAFDTGFIDAHFDAADLAPSAAEQRVAAIAAGLVELSGSAPSGDGAATAEAPELSRWAQRRR